MPKFAAVFAVFLVSFAAVTSAFSQTQKSKTIVFFGDSLTAGYGLDEPLSQAYPARIQEKIDAAHLPYKTVNAGLSGETTAGGLRRVDWILRQPVDIFVLALGGNDGLRGIEPSVSMANLQAIIDRVRAKNPNVKIILGGMMMPPSMGEDYVRDFAAMYPALATKNKIGFVPFLLQDVGGHADLNQADQIHPTAAGQRIVAENIWKVLQPLL
jgi:acyl-CoA thioesterase-1